jgi:hypothetical protein
MKGGEISTPFRPNLIGAERGEEKFSSPCANHIREEELA